MKPRLITFITIALLVGVIVNLSRSIYSLWQQGSRVHTREDVLKIAKQKNIELKRKLAQVESPAYIEQQAREKLNLSREDEYVIILPQNLVDQYKVVEGNVQGIQSELPPYQQWLHLFF